MRKTAFAVAVAIASVFVVVPALLESGGGLVAATVGCQPAAPSWKAGDKVDVEWKGSWWQGEILEDKGAGQYKVHYVGWASSWDEVVPAARLRKPSGSAQKGTGS